MVDKLMKFFALSLFYVCKVKKIIIIKKVLSHGFYGMLENKILTRQRTQKIIFLFFWDQFSDTVW